MKLLSIKLHIITGNKLLTTVFGISHLNVTSMTGLNLFLQNLQLKPSLNDHNDGE